MASSEVNDARSSSRSATTKSSPVTLDRFSWSWKSSSVMSSHMLSRSSKGGLSNHFLHSSSVPAPSLRPWTPLVRPMPPAARQFTVIRNRKGGENEMRSSSSDPLSEFMPPRPPSSLKTQLG
eukprot:CAMPEP_0185781278 /NCGR_PEP_ID=MMETSP1174-20130828/101779_1 /TAXON_ID=35687 /ORGANISM="Dictyocha speculum, Strain CCMP1381" /LENGTH=121 /DNA_ID=CAMNT_0028471187 /DNA_START=394 /DNA_END=759 /DNA_ORIENTATION=+